MGHGGELGYVVINLVKPPVINDIPLRAIKPLLSSPITKTAEKEL